MAAYTRILLGIVLCAATVYGLQCFTCDGGTSNDQCLTATTCPSSATSCLTSVGVPTSGGSGIMAIVKACAHSCTPIKTELLGVSVTVTCCGTDLCNRSAGAGLTPSYTAIILALGSILTILRSSVM